MGPEIDLRLSILDRIEGGAERQVWTPRDFLDLGNRDAIDKVLQRLARSGILRRIDRGLYDKPDINGLTRQPEPPDPRHVVDAIVRRDQIRVLVDGMTAANDLGLTNAVPSKTLVHTDARLKTIKLGRLDIIFKPTAPSKLFWAGRPAMRIVQALHWLRDTMGQTDPDLAWHKRLNALITDPRHGPALVDDLADGMATLPAWMQDVLRPMIAQARRA